MDNQQIEAEAVSRVKTRVNLTGFLSSYLDENDKTPSWDGFIYIYDSKRKTNDNFIGRLPAQIKGHETQCFDKKEISYEIKITHLRNYLNDGGTVLFVVYLSPNENKTDFIYKIYYSELTPVKISALLSKCKVEQQDVSIHLIELPPEPNDFASLIRNCFDNCKRQASFAGVDLPTISELEEKGVLESIHFYVSGYGDEYKTARGFIKLDTPLYAQIKGAAIPQPVKFEGEMTHKIISMVIPNKVSSAGKVFYTEYKTIETAEESKICIGHGLTITFSNDKPGCRVNFKSPSMLRQFVEDAPFIIALSENKQFKINDTLVDFSKDQINITGSDLDKYKNTYKYFSRCCEMMRRQGCMEDIDYTKLSDEDWRNMERLAQATLEEKPIHGLQEKLPPYAFMNVGPLKFALELQAIDDKGTYKIRHFQDGENIKVPISDEEELALAPSVFILSADDYRLVSNIKYDKIIPSLDTLPKNHDSCHVACIIMRRMISAADKVEGERRNVLLDTAYAISQRLDNQKDDIWDKRIKNLDRLQIFIRQRPLTEEEKGTLYGLIAGSIDDKDLLFAANVLLGKKDKAKELFDSFSQPDQELFMQEPIYYLFQNECML